jgi:hypothetical protein
MALRRLGKGQGRKHNSDRRRHRMVWFASHPCSFVPPRCPLYCGLDLDIMERKKSLMSQREFENRLLARPSRGGLIDKATNIISLLLLLLVFHLCSITSTTGQGLTDTVTCQFTILPSTSSSRHEVYTTSLCVV